MSTPEFSRAVEEIKDRSPLSEVVGKYVGLKRAGRRMVGLCPFHEDSQPSFYVDDERGFYHCFGCGAGGDVIRFIMEMDGLSFMDVVTELARQTGVDLPKTSQGPGDPDRTRQVMNRLGEINRLAARFFHNALLQDPACIGARNYLKRRSIGDEDITRFGLGCAPDSWDALLSFLGAKGYEAGEIDKAGLAKPGNRGHYDRFRNRLMFPILMREGQVLGFSGRTLSSDDREAKYINTPETPLYHKSKVLFGHHLAREAIRKSGVMLMVEGNVDVLRMHAFGFGNTVAPCGTATSEDQIRMIKRMGCSLVLIFDGDAAGRKAAWRVVPMAMAQMLPTKVVFLPEGRDPDDLLMQQGAGAMTGLIENARDLFPEWINARMNDIRGNTEEVASFIHDVADVIAAVQDAPARALYIPRAAYLLGVDEGVVRQAVRDSGRRKRVGPDIAPATAVAAQPEEAPASQLEVQLLATLSENGQVLADPAVRQRLEVLTTVPSFSRSLNPRVRDLLQTVLSDPDSAGSLLMTGDFGAQIRAWLMESGGEEAAGDSAEEVVFLLANLEMNAIEGELDRLGIEIKRMEHAGQKDRLDALKMERRALSVRRVELKGSLARSEIYGR